MAVLPMLAGIAALPYVISQTFEHERTAAEPDLSIEYAYFVEQPVVETSRISEESQKLINTRSMQEFIRDDGGQSAYTLLQQLNTSDSVAREKLKTFLEKYRIYLRKIQEQHHELLEMLPDLTRTELLEHAHSLLDSLYGLSDDELRQRVGKAIKKIRQDYANHRKTVSELISLVASHSSRVLLAVRVLNKGARDGLVRHLGSVSYEGQCFRLSRVAPPSSPRNVLAVPTFSVNQDWNKFAPQAVGKVESDSMVEFWFELSSEDTGNVAYEEACRSTHREPVSVCAQNEEVTIVLKDQEKNRIERKVGCNSEEVSDV